jgi:putative addiction module component (TIGR02574 family)
MAHSLALPPPGFDDLTLEEQVDYIQALWQRISSRTEEAPTPHWHREIVRERVAAYEAEPRNVRNWEEVQNRIRADLKK